MILRDQHPTVADTARSVAALRRMVTDEQRAVLVTSTGARARNVRTFTVINGFAATLQTADASRMSTDPRVLAVVPDRTIHFPKPQRLQSLSGGQTGTAAPTRACPARADHPLVEPEAISLIHADRAHQITRGAGVKVGVVADGLDVSTPEYIRPDGTPVIADYRDFTGASPAGPVGFGEANGDVSSIAAQGTGTYDLAEYAGPAHPLSAGCTIRVRGVAPDTTLDVMRSIGSDNSATASALLQGIDWAVTVDHVDVLNLSLGGNLFPDRPFNPISLAVQAAVRAGVTVVVCTGDDGPGNTNETPSTTSSAIAVGASTQNQIRAQLSTDAFSLSNGRWESDQISPFSSSGITEGARTLSLVAPGDFGWAACTPDPDSPYCSDIQGRPSSLTTFAGTSEAAPLVSGTAALVIAAYRSTHHGATPAPTVVKRILTSTARDLAVPSSEQGAGLVDTYTAVRAAQSYGLSDVAGGGVVSTPDQLSLTASARTARTHRVTLRNTEPRATDVRAVLRHWATLTDSSTTVNVNPSADPTFVDEYGTTRTYHRFSVAVAPGADRLTVAYAYPGRPIDATGYDQLVRLTLLTPNGTFAGSTAPFGGGNDNWGTVEIQRPTPGPWTAILWGAPPTSPYVYSGFVNVRTTTWRARLHTIATARLARGAALHVAVRLTTPDQPGDASTALLVQTGTHSAAIPITTRALVPVPGRFAATLGGGDGRPGFEAWTQSWFFNVPRGHHDLDASLALSGDPTETVLAFLVAPDGQVVGQTTNFAADFGYRNTMQLWHARPAAGRWQLLVIVENPVSGEQITQTVSGRLRLDAARVTVTGLPRTVRSGGMTTVRVRVRNTGNTTQLFALDPRLTTPATVPLVVTGSHQTLPQSLAAPATWLVPPHTTSVTASAAATIPVDLEATTYANYSPYYVTSAPTPLVMTAPAISQGEWTAYATAAGPLTHPVTGTVDFRAKAVTLPFDPNATPANGDPWLAAIGPSSAASPVAIAPGASAVLTMLITPMSARPTVVNALVDVDTFDPALGSGDVMATVSYRYSVTRAT